MGTPSLTVLLIDDDAALRHVTSRYLNRAGMICVSFEDAISGLGVAGTLLPDVVVCDLSLDEMTGFDFAARMRSRSITANIPVILMSGYSLPEPTPVTKASTCVFSFLEKPFTSEQLLHAILTASISKRLG
jgi:CheY-like chemotaxis protein